MSAMASDAALGFGFGTPWEAQIEFLRQKLNLPTEHWDDIVRSAHDRAFIVAGAQKAEMLDDLHKAVLDAAKGGGLEDFRKEFKAIVARHGWSGWTGEATADGIAWRTKVIYTTNMSSSYAAARYQQLTHPDSIKSMPFWRYVHSDSVQHPRIYHLAWNGLTLPYDHPFWQTHFAPNGWGCQCRIVGVTRREGLLSRYTTPPDGWTAIDERTGAPVGIDKGWDYAPGASVTKRFQSLIDDKLIKLDSPIGARMWEELKPVLAMERQQQWWETLDAWMNSPQTGRQAVIGALKPETLSWLKSEKGIDPVSAAIGIREGLIRGAKQARHIAAQDGLLETEWRRLPEIVESPEEIYFDTRTGKLVYVVSVGDGSGIKLSVEFDYRVSKTERLNMIVSGFRQSNTTIEELVRGKLYVPLP